jgi:hypothetical protein
MAKKPTVKWRGKEAVKIAQEAGLKALRTGGEKILTEAIKAAPVDTGTLRRSGTVTVGALPEFERVYESAKAGNEMGKAFPGETGKEKAVYVSFSTPYALRQHEELDYHHPKGGGPKYLETPHRQLESRVKRMAEAAIKKALRETK